MSTLDECRAQGLLFSIGGNLRRRQQALRLLMACSGAMGVLRRDLAGMTSDDFFPGSNTPLMQAADIFNRFVAGEGLDHPLPPHEMSPLGEGVWRIRTPDLRFDGWFPERNFFVIAAVNTKNQCKLAGFNDAICQHVIIERQTVNLNNGTYVTSEDYRDLI